MLLVSSDQNNNALMHVGNTSSYYEILGCLVVPLHHYQQITAVVGNKRRSNFGCEIKVTISHCLGFLGGRFFFLCLQNQVFPRPRKKNLTCKLTG